MTKTLILIPSQFEFEHLFGSKKELQNLESSGIHARICGIGPAASAFMTGQYINQIHPDHVLLCGIAGAFREGKVQPGDVVAVSSEIFADLGFSENSFPVSFDQINVPLLTAPDGSQLSCTYSLPTIPDFQTVNSITVSTVTSDDNMSKYLYGTHQVEIENMEGAAVALACRYCGVPMSEIRSISNFVGPRNKDAWEMELALDSLKSSLTSYLNQVLLERRYS